MCYDNNTKYNTVTDIHSDYIYNNKTTFKSNCKLNLFVNKYLIITKSL